MLALLILGFGAMTCLFFSVICEISFLLLFIPYLVFVFFFGGYRLYILSPHISIFGNEKYYPRPFNKWVLEHAVEFFTNVVPFKDLTEKEIKELHQELNFDKEFEYKECYQFSDQFGILILSSRKKSGDFYDITGVYLVDPQNKPYTKLTDQLHVLNKEHFTALGSSGEKLWEMFKTACVHDLLAKDVNKEPTSAQIMEQQRLDQELSQKLNSQVILPNGWSKVCQKSDLKSNKIDPYLLEQLERFIQHSSCPIACKNTVRDLIDLFRQLQDSRWIQRCNSYYIPEILELLSEISKGTTKEIKQECEETISRFEKQLRTIMKNSDLQRKSEEQRVMLSTFQAMMEMDGLIPDMIQDELNKQK